MISVYVYAGAFAQPELFSADRLLPQHKLAVKERRRAGYDVVKQFFADPVSYVFVIRVDAPAVEVRAGELLVFIPVVYDSVFQIKAPFYC